MEKLESIVKKLDQEVKALRESLGKSRRELTELKATISIAFNSEDLGEIRKKVKRACIPFWEHGRFEKEMKEWSKEEWGKLYNS